MRKQGVKMKKVIILMLFLTGIAVFSAELPNKSVYTSIKDRECKRPSGSFRKIYPYEEDNTAVECSGQKNYRIFKVFQSGREWLDISDGKNLWTTSKEVMGGNFGTWPHIREGVAEWRVTKSGEVKALIFRIDALEDELNGKIQSRLYVIGLDSETPALCGIVKTNKEAAALADKGRCTKKLNLKE